MIIRFFVLSFVFLLCVAPLHTRADASSAARLSPVIARALSYERTLPSRAGGSLDILILHAANNASSQGEAAAFARGLGALSRSTVQGLPMRATVAPYSTGAIETGAANGVDVVVVCSGLDLLSALTTTTRRRRLLTVGVERQHAVNATTLAVLMEDGRAKIIVNLAHARAEGVELSSQLLRLAEVL
ncbi:MAG: DUF4154 domain-containing protein [Sandaracinaceae bacterium]|nr:DUF4154 domain-containing protein [Sandaracinaceae bacterium]